MQGDFPRVRLIDAGDQSEKGRFAGTVDSDQSEDGGIIDFKIQIIENCL